MHLLFSTMHLTWFRCSLSLNAFCHCWKTEIPTHVFFLCFLTPLANSSSQLSAISLQSFLLLQRFATFCFSIKVSCKSYLKPSWTFWLRPAIELAAGAIILSASYSSFQNKVSVILPTKHTSCSHSWSNTMIPWCTVSTSLDMHHMILTTAVSYMEYQ